MKLGAIDPNKIQARPSTSGEAYGDEVEEIEEEHAGAPVPDGPVEQPVMIRSPSMTP